jgi:signal transduction histidine kinase
MVAKSPQRVPLTRWHRLVDVLESDWVFRWPTLAAYALAGVLFATASEYSRLTVPNALTAVGVAAATVTTTIVLIVLAGFIIRPLRQHRAAAVVTALVSIGIVRAVLTTAFVDELGINRETFFASRLLLSAGAVPVVVIVCAVITSAVTAGWRERATTQRAINRLRDERDEILADIARTDEAILVESESVIRPRVDSIVSSLGDTPRTTVSEMLDNLINTVVRPLSHSLAARAGTHIANEAITSPLPRPDLPDAERFVGPPLGAVGVFMTTVVILFDATTIPVSLAAGAIGAGVTFVGLRAFQLGMSGLRLRVPLITVIIICAHAGIGFIVVWVDISLFSRYGFGPENTVALVSATLVAGLVYVAQRLAIHFGDVRLAELAFVRREMRLVVSEVRRRAWLRQRHIAHALHSAIQSRILAESQLVQTGKGPLTVAETNRIQSTLSGVFDVLRSTDGLTSDPLKEMRRAVEFWAGMCSIELNVKDSVGPLLANDSEIGESVLLTTLEIINNAIRHGKATTMAVSISRPSPDLIKIVASNNGRAMVDFSPGLGMSMFDELTVDWTVTHDGGMTFTGHIAARPPTSTRALQKLDT